VELLLGAGSSRLKQLPWNGKKGFDNLVTIDFNSDHNPDAVHDLESLPLPFADNSFDEIHAYHVLEHLGQQGDFRFFFAQFADFWRMLKPDGVLCAIVPRIESTWSWGDPGHKRIICRESLVFLTQPEYDAQIGASPMTDYRFVFKEDFDLVHSAYGAEHYEFVLKAIKPSRCKK
jgi:SAM-dependent methyltransferase